MKHRYYGMTFGVLFGVLLMTASLVKAQTSPAKPINLVAVGAGALLVEEPPSYSTDPGNWSPMALQDENPDTGWASPNGDLTPKTFVFELAERSRINSLTFDTARTENPERSARHVRVEISDNQGAGYAPILSTALAKQKANQTFTLKTPATGRYLRLTLVDNWGDPKYNELMEISAWGQQLTHTPLPDNSGTFSSNFGDFHMLQSGATVAGCYEHKEGLIQNGGFDGRVLRFTWREGKAGSYSSGPAILIFSADGNSFRGFWAYQDVKGFNGVWNGKRVSREVGSCPYWKPGGNAVEQQLASEGRVRLYGILFDTDSARLKDESKTALDQLVATARAQPSWKFLIEGHTDNTGGDVHNQGLSEERATAVKDYLIKAGINASRLSTKGFGASQPVASNDTSAGRSQNRRVEVVRK
jgi:OmpA-OmpF porin, OOP family